MYPYFTKYPSDLSAAEQPASGNLLQDFLSQNPAYGTLQFQVTGGQGAFPIVGAQITLTHDLDDTHSFSITTQTDASGKSDALALPAPLKALSQSPQSPGNPTPFVTYRAWITAPDYIPVEVLDIPVFDGVATIQPVAMEPELGGTHRMDVEIIEDKEPDL